MTALERHEGTGGKGTEHTDEDLVSDQLVTVTGRETGELSHDDHRPLRAGRAVDDRDPTGRAVPDRQP